MTTAATPLARRVTVLALGLAGALATGCGSSYVVQGRVVHGTYSDARFVMPDDAELEQEGVAGATVKLYRDPDTPNLRLISSTRADRSGRVALAVDTFGAGWMEERWLIEVVCPGYETLETFVHLPSAKLDERLLVVLPRGHTVMPKPREDLWEEYKTYR